MRLKSRGKKVEEALERMKIISRNQKERRKKEASLFSSCTLFCVWEEKDFSF